MVGEEVILDTGQQKSGGPVQQDVMGHRVICDGLLCSILKAMSNSANKDEFISVIERDCDEEEILASRLKLFSFYGDVVCDKQKKPILEITRGSVRKNIEDIVMHMVKIDKTETSEIFYMPWNYVAKPFNSDSDIRAEMIEKELCTEMDAKIDTLKNEMNAKNQALMEVINTRFHEVIQQVSTMTASQPVSFAAAVAANARQPGAGLGNVQENGAQPGPTARGPVGGYNHNPAFKVPGQPDHIRGRGYDRQQGGDDGGVRDRSNSKRRRVEDSSNDEKSVRERSGSQSRQRKFVVGTSNQSGRKMRSPPADIFVYGVHPDTTPDDIVQDLACCDIIIKPEDIVKKSKDEAFLTSYKISVKAEDLQKALNPSIWPLRVKVREFIHYSRRPAAVGSVGRGPRHQGQVYQPQQGYTGPVYQHGQGHHRQQGQGHEHERENHHQAGVIGVGGTPGQFLAPNRYALPEDNVPGGTVPVV